MLLMSPLGALLISTGVQAKVGRCLLQVNGKTYLNGPCVVVMTDQRGSFSMGVEARHRSRYFAYVTKETDGTRGYWNETPDASHAHSDLGILRRNGACWTNERARVCAYK